MRIRHKPWARPELEACPFYVSDPDSLRGRWQESFELKQPLWLELGCGKGGFISEMAVRYPDKNFIAIDIKSEMLVLAKRKIEEKDPDALRHVRILSKDIERSEMMLAPEDRIERIFINFCPPWPRTKEIKHRLTHPKQLAHYKTFLVPGGEIWFKTDDRPLYLDSVRYFEENGFTIRYQTENLSESGFTESVVTEHEAMFTAQGKPTHFLIAVFDGN